MRDMRTKAPPLLPIFRSELQGRLLALLYADPSRGWTISELAAALSVHVATVQREVERQTAFKWRVDQTRPAANSAPPVAAEWG